MRLTRKWMLNSMKSSYICPRSAALPWEYSRVEVAMGYLMYRATISDPLLVGNFRISTFSLWGNWLSTRSPVNSSVSSLYEGGFGGKKANLAAIVDVTPPIPPPEKEFLAAPFCCLSSFPSLYSLCFHQSCSVGVVGSMGVWWNSPPLALLCKLRWTFPAVLICFFRKPGEWERERERKKQDIIAVVGMENCWLLTMLCGVHELWCHSAG